MLLCLFAWTRGCLLIVMWCKREERNYGISQGQSFFPASQHPNQHKFSGKIFYFDKDWFLAVLPYQYLPTLWIKVKFPRKEISSHLIVIVIIALYRQRRVHKKRNNLKYRHWVRNQYQLITTQGLNQESSGQPRTLKSPLPSIRSLDHCVFYETYCILLYIIIFSGFDSVSNYLDVQAKSNPLLPGNLTLCWQCWFNKRETREVTRENDWLNGSKTAQHDVTFCQALILYFFELFCYF